VSGNEASNEAQDKANRHEGQREALADTNQMIWPAAFELTAEQLEHLLVRAASAAALTNAGISVSTEVDRETAYDAVERTGVLRERRRNKSGRSDTYRPPFFLKGAAMRNPDFQEHQSAASLRGLSS